jgi:hypothetical protein
MTLRSSVHTDFRTHPSPDIDFILFPYEQPGCILYDDPLAGLKAEELCEGADEVVRHWMRKLRTHPVPPPCSRGQ